MKTLLKNWLFATGENADCLKDGAPVTVPHTWSIDENLQDYVGKGWYRTKVQPDPFYERVFLRFRGAYRDAAVYVQNQLAGKHGCSGYAPFEVEITPFMNPGGDTEITVSVDNSFSENALPYSRSFDWANDGGLYRPVECIKTGKARIQDVQLQAQPVILPSGKRQNEGPAVFGFRAALDGAGPGDRVQWALYRGAEDSLIPRTDAPLLSGILKNGEALEPQVLPKVFYWHFDRPALYTLRLTALTDGETVSDQREIVFGFRELRLQGTKWYLNGEAVRLPGMEWMPGSDPEKGAAENREDMEKMLKLLKESNSVLTRFHWQQDDDVFDWCDRHGMLVQEEIPFWGKQPEGDPEELWPIVQRQLKEMISAHRHHPSIIAWGVGNELSAQREDVRKYIRKAVSYAKALDESRLVNYVTNTAWQNPFQDGAMDGDALCINDYIGTWHQGLEQESAWRELLEDHPGRAFIPSEFGLCEPAFAGGDPAREKIFLEKTASYRPKEQIVGTVYFCLNDYRTHMGEEGEGKLRRRVHGSVDWKGNPKPSYDTVQREHSPLMAERTEKGIRFTCRNDLPRYAVQGYYVQIGNERVDLPDLQPGESYEWNGKGRKENISIFRPNGDYVLSV